MSQADLEVARGVRRGRGETGRMKVFRVRWIFGALASIAVGLPPAAAADQRISSSHRPHTRVATYQRGGVIVRRLLFQGHRSSHRIVGTMGVAVDNRSRTTRTVQLRIGRCRGGPLARPVCPSARSVLLRIPSQRRISAFRRVRLRQPSTRDDQIEVSVTRPGARPPISHAFNYANLLLRGRAWRSGASTWYGLQAGRAIVGEAVVRAVVDVPATARSSIRPSIAWSGTAAGGTPWVTAVRLCATSFGCDAAPEARRWTTMATTGRVAFQERPSFTANSASVQVTVDGGHGRLLTVDLPRPI
jgi:hypothetical protein